MAQTSVARYIWYGEVQTYRTYTSVQPVLKNRSSMFLNQYTWMFWMMRWLVLPTSPPGPWLTISTPPIETSPRSIWKQFWTHAPSMGSPTTCLILVQTDSRLRQLFRGRRRYYRASTANQLWIWKKKLQLGTSWAPVAGGTKNLSLKKLGHTLRPTSQPPTVSTRKCKVNLPQHPDTIQSIKLSDKLKNRWLRAPLGHYKTSPKQLQRTVACWYVLYTFLQLSKSW
jgi:hypothetical protein